MIRRLAIAAAALLVCTLTVLPDDALARAGSSTSTGSSGSRTYSAPPSTSTSPGSTAPMQRSMTPQTAPSPTPYGQPAPAFGGRSPFMSGLMGGLLGAGIGGMLFGGGMFHGMSGFSGFLGFLIQIFLVIVVGRLIWGFFARRMAQPLAAGPAGYARDAGAMPAGGGGGGAPQLNISPADFHAFEELLHGVTYAEAAE